MVVNGTRTRLLGDDRRSETVSASMTLIGKPCCNWPETLLLPLLFQQQGLGLSDSTPIGRSAPCSAGVRIRPDGRFLGEECVALLIPTPGLCDDLLQRPARPFGGIVRRPRRRSHSISSPTSAAGGVLNGSSYRTPLSCVGDDLSRARLPPAARQCHSPSR